MRSASRLFSKDVKQEMTGVKENTLSDLEDKLQKQTSPDAGILEYKEIVAMMENKNQILFHKTEMIVKVENLHMKKGWVMGRRDSFKMGKVLLSLYLKK